MCVCIALCTIVARTSNLVLRDVKVRRVSLARLWALLITSATWVAGDKSRLTMCCNVLSVVSHQSVSSCLKVWPAYACVQPSSLALINTAGVHVIGQSHNRRGADCTLASRNGREGDSGPYTQAVGLISRYEAYLTRPGKHAEVLWYGRSALNDSAACPFDYSLLHVAFIVHSS